MITEGVVRTPNIGYTHDEMEDDCREHGIQTEGSYLVMTMQQSQPVLKETMLAAILQFLEKEEVESSRGRHFSQDPFLLTHYGYRCNEEVAVTVMKYFVDHPEKAAGVLPEVQFCLMGSKIPLSILLAEDRVLDTTKHSFIRPSVRVSMYNRLPDWKISTTVIVEQAEDHCDDTTEYDKMLHKSFVS